MLFEEIQNRKRTGIQHLSDEVLKKIMLSFNSKVDGEDKESHLTESSVKEKKKLNMTFSYDILCNSDKAEKLSYVRCSQP